jgi:hypothetical protein
MTDDMLAPFDHPASAVRNAQPVSMAGSLSSGGGLLLLRECGDRHRQPPRPMPRASFKVEGAGRREQRALRRLLVIGEETQQYDRPRSAS